MSDWWIAIECGQRGWALWLDGRRESWRHPRSRGRTFGLVVGRVDRGARRMTADQEPDERYESCPTCGAAVVVATSGEGTSYYIPAVSPDAWASLKAERDRLAAGLRARGVIPGRNPDGVVDDVEKLLTLYDDALAERDALRTELAAEQREADEQPPSAHRRLIDACNGAIGELANAGTNRIPQMMEGLARIRDDIAQGRWQDDEWDELTAERDALRIERDQLREIAAAARDVAKQDCRNCRYTQPIDRLRAVLDDREA